MPPRTWGTRIQSRTESLGPVTEQHFGGVHNSQYRKKRGQYLVSDPKNDGGILSLSLSHFPIRLVFRKALVFLSHPFKLLDAWGGCKFMVKQMFIAASIMPAPYFKLY